MATYGIRQLTDRQRAHIQPCAICDNTKFLQMIKPDQDTWQVKCMSCMVTGPVMASSVGAIEGWDRLWD